MRRVSHPFLIRSVVSICAGAMLAVSASAWSADATEEAPPTAMERLQHFSDRASDLAMQAMTLLGINYKRGGNSPETGLDCSGFVRYVFKEAWGTDLPRTSAEISKVGKPVSTSELQPGDLVFYNTLRRGFSHVGIYLGDDRFIHAPSTGGHIRVESMSLNYWRKRFNGARRIDDPEQTDSVEKVEKPNT